MNDPPKNELTFDEFKKIVLEHLDTVSTSEAVGEFSSEERVLSFSQNKIGFFIVHESGSWLVGRAGNNYQGFPGIADSLEQAIEKYKRINPPNTKGYYPDILLTFQEFIDRVVNYLGGSYSHRMSDGFSVDGQSQFSFVHENYPIKFSFCVGEWRYQHKASLVNGFGRSLNEAFESFQEYLEHAS